MQAAKKAVESVKETAANIGASAKSGLEKTKATLQEKVNLLCISLLKHQTKNYLFFFSFIFVHAWGMLHFQLTRIFLMIIMENHKNEIGRNRVRR